MKKKKNENEVREGTPNRADTGHGSTTQGGSNFGQGSSQLGKDGGHQGSESNRGSSYENESELDTEALRTPKE